MLRAFIEDRRRRRKNDKNPPIASVDEAERRRVDELEKLRQRNAIGLLDSIHALATTKTGKAYRFATR